MQALGGLCVYVGGVALYIGLWMACWPAALILTGVGLCLPSEDKGKPNG